MVSGVLHMLSVAFAIFAFTPDTIKASLGIAGSLRSIGRRALNIDYDSLNLAHVGPELGGYAVGSGLFAFRSGVISSISQLDRGEREAAMETLRVTIASLAMETTQTFGLPVMSAIIDKMVNQYGHRFSRTVQGFRSYNQMLSDSILHQASNVAAPGLIDEGVEVLDQLDTIKNRMKVDFADEVTSFLQSSQAHNDLVTSLEGAKSWAKVARWADFLLGPIFDMANIAFTGWQLHQAVQAGDELSIASGSLGIVGSVVGIGAFVAGSLATAGGIIAATAGPVGVIIGCILSLASLIIDVINRYNPEQTITHHLELVRSLTAASKDMLGGAHKTMIESATSNGVNAGFNKLYEINQAMLVKAKISDEWDTIRGFNGLEQNQLEFRPNIVREEGEFLVVGDMRVFDQRYYQNWAFRPEGREEIGYSYYGKDITEDDGGIFVRLNTDMVTNKDSNMWFWLNGAKITTYRPGEEEREADDNVNIGDFRTLWMSSGRMVEVNTGGGNDLIQMTGIICSTEQQQRLDGKCVIARMGNGYDEISFEGLDTREEKLEWFLSNSDLSQKKMVVGISFDMVDFWLKYRLKGDDDQIEEVRFGGTLSVEGFIGSPLDDVVKFSDDQEYSIKQSCGDNVYEYHIATRRQPCLIFIEDNSDTPGHLILHHEAITWQNVVFCVATNMIIVQLGEKKQARVLLKRSKPGLERFRVTINNDSTKTIPEIRAFDRSTDLLMPFAPFPYRFDRNLAGTLPHNTYVELLLPAGNFTYPAKIYTMTFEHNFNYVIISPELLEALRNNEYELRVFRRRPSADTRWAIWLKRPRTRGGWILKTSEYSYIVLGTPGAEQLIVALSREDRPVVDIYEQYRLIMQEIVFDGTGSVYGKDQAERLIMKIPQRWSTRDPPGSYVIDLKGPRQPTETRRNELVFDDRLISFYYNMDMSRYMIMELERESTEDDWKLKIFSNWSVGKIPRLTITLKGVHAIIAGPSHRWQLIFNLYESTELFHDLNTIMFYTVGTQYRNY